VKPSGDAHGSSKRTIPSLARRLLVLIAAGLLVSTRSLPDEIGDPVFAADFEDGPPWSARDGIRTELVDDPGRGTVMHVAGTQDGGWNYAGAGAFPLQAGHLYKLRGWVRVESVRPRAPAVLQGRVRKLGRPGPEHRPATTPEYDLWTGGWQQLIVEFEVPAEADSGWVALEKGTDAPVAFDGFVDDVVVVELDAYSEHPYHFTEVPAPLAALRSTHPRLYLTAASREDLRGRLADEPWASRLEDLRRVADRGVRDGPPAYRRATRSSSGRGRWAT